MYKLKPFISNKIWGYEQWIFSTLDVGKSVIEDYEFGSKDVLLKDIIGDYPLLIKIIQANETLSVQVHPDDDYAKIYENSLGKTECWYILDATQDASIICGLKSEYSKDDLKKAIQTNSLESYMQYLPVSKGDFVFIPAGTVHAINGGLRLLEVQEASDITYRLYDWGRGRELHVEKGLKVIKNIVCNIEKKFTGSFDCEYFSLEVLSFENNENSVCSITDTKDFILFNLSGNGVLFSDEKKELKCSPETTIFCCKNEKINVKGSCSFLKIVSNK